MWPVLAGWSFLLRYHLPKNVCRFVFLFWRVDAITKQRSLVSDSWSFGLCSDLFIQCTSESCDDWLWCEFSHRRHPKLSASGWVKSDKSFHSSLPNVSFWKETQSLLAYSVISPQKCWSKLWETDENKALRIFSPREITSNISSDMHYNNIEMYRKYMSILVPMSFMVQVFLFRLFRKPNIFMILFYDTMDVSVFVVKCIHLTQNQIAHERGKPGRDSRAKGHLLQSLQYV